MIEFPESYTMAKQIQENLNGKIVSEVIVLQSPHKFAFFWGEKDDYPELLEGKKITGATNYGGMLQIELEDMILVLSDGAYPKYYENNQLPKKSQLLIKFDDDTAIGVSIQMYGGIGVSKKDDCQEPYYISSSTKPSVISDTFTFEYFKQLYDKNRDRKISAKAFLATEQRIPGLGNGVLQDILYQAGIHPKCSIASFTEEELNKLYHVIVDTIKQMCEQGGRDTEKDIFGHAGGYQTWLSKRTVWTPCTKCGYEIRKSAYMGGTIYFCEHCQRL